MSILPCSAPNCEAPTYVKKRQLCRSHYNRLALYGDLNLEVVVTECVRCNSTIRRERKAAGPAPKYCTTDCKRKAAYERHIASGAYDAEQAARREASRAKPINRPTCVSCGNQFESKHKAPRFCSQRCNNRFLDANNPIRCSESDCDRGVRAKGLCSLHWRRKARADGREANSEWNERRKANYQQRRALKLQLPADNIRPVDVYERDEWVCGLCFGAVGRDTFWPDPMSPSLDHILPLSKGGHHILANVQLAHLACNVRKGANTEADAISA